MLLAEPTSLQPPMLTQDQSRAPAPKPAPSTQISQLASRLPSRFCGPASCAPLSDLGILPPKAGQHARSDISRWIDTALGRGRFDDEWFDAALRQNPDDACRTWQFFQPQGGGRDAAFIARDSLPSSEELLRCEMVPGDGHTLGAATLALLAAINQPPLFLHQTNPSRSRLLHHDPRADRTSPWRMTHLDGTSAFVHTSCMPWQKVSHLVAEAIYDGFR